MTPKEAEEYVRSCWPERRLHIYFPSGGFPLLYDFPEIYSGKVDDFPQNIDDIWLAAAEFTKQREEEIRQKQAEIAWLSDEVASSLDMTQQGTENGDIFIAGFSAKALATQSRILAVLEAQLAALLVGWKETP